MKKQPRILLSLCEIAGYFSHLKRGFKESGNQADTAFVREHPLDYKDEQNNCFIHKMLLLNSKALFAKRSIIFRIPFFVIYRFILLPIFFIQCLFKYDVFIFGFRKTFLPFLWDLPILKLFKKKIIFVFFGSDSRPAYLNGSLTGFSLQKINRMTLRIKKDMVKIEKYADHIIDAPSSGVFHEKKIINWFYIGMPQKQEAAKASVSSKITTILHSPSNPEAKGTPLIREVIEELKKEGHQFEYIEMINRTNQQVLDAICESDFVIDQIYSDTPMAGFATEAAFYGKPAIVGGYELERISKILPEESRPPSYIIKPTKEKLKKAILHLIDDTDFRKKLGKQAQDFVHKNWDAAQVAKRFFRIINNDIPEEWYIDPYKMDFINGCCIEDKRRKHLVNEYISNYGTAALCLSDKKELEEKLLENIGN